MSAFPRLTKIGGGNSRGNTIEADLISTQSIDSIHSRQHGKFVGQFGRNGGVPVNRGTPGRAEIEVGGNFAFHPLNDGGAKASDHDADGGHHGDGGRKRSDEYRRAAKRTEKAARSE